jgi:hypothetical protein
MLLKALASLTPIGLTSLTGRGLLGTPRRAGFLPDGWGSLFHPL